MSLDQECLAEHVASSAFQDGVARGYWDLIEIPGIMWPYVMIWIAAAPRPNSPDKYHLRFLLRNYPELGPTATVWDITRNAKLETGKWPKGIERVKQTFRTDWYNADALYAPWDRIAMYGDPDRIRQFGPHTDWVTKYPGEGWQRTYTIVHYLQLTHELLISEQYYGC